MGYIHDAQTDLAFRYDFAQDLTGYTAVMYYYKQEEGNDDRATVTCTVTVVTSVLSYVSYSQTSALFTDHDCDYIAYVGLTSSTARKRSSNPVVIHVNKEGKIEYAQ